MSVLFVINIFVEIENTDKYSVRLWKRRLTTMQKPKGVSEMLEHTIPTDSIG